MVTVLVIIAILTGLGVLEWRSRNKPLHSGLKDHWRVNPSRQSGRAETGGHDFDSRHD